MINRNLVPPRSPFVVPIWNFKLSAAKEYAFTGGLQPLTSTELTIFKSSILSRNCSILTETESRKEWTGNLSLRMQGSSWNTRTLHPAIRLYRLLAYMTKLF